MARILGIGGIFFKATDADVTKTWYKDVLGLPVDEYGALFAFEENGKPAWLQWSVMSAKTTYFDPSEASFMINYRVDDLTGFLAGLAEKGVHPVDEVEDTPYGKFVHLLDADGSKIELWEAKDPNVELTPASS